MTGIRSPELLAMWLRDMRTTVLEIGHYLKPGDVERLLMELAIFGHILERHAVRARGLERSFVEARRGDGKVVDLAAWIRSRSDDPRDPDQLALWALPIASTTRGR